MKKLVAIFLSALLALGLLTACGSADTTAPEITGVKATASVQVNSEFDALAGVTATDNKDGDITSKIVVTSIPALTFVNGKATPTQQGSYEITYSVTDKAGNEGTAYTTLTVTRAVSEEESYKKFTISDTDYTGLDDFGLEVVTDGTGAATLGFNDGVLRLNVTNAGETAADVKLVKEFETKANAEYDVILYMKASAAATVTYGEAQSLAVGTTYAEHKIAYAAAAEAGNVRLELAFGKQAENAANYTVDILYAKFVERVGTQRLESVFASDFSNPEATGLGTSNFANPENLGQIAYADGKAVVTYNGNNSGLRLEQETTVTLEKDKTYRISLSMTSVEAVEAIEFCVEDKVTEWANRAYFAHVSIPANNEAYTFIGDVTAPNDLENACLRLYIGTKPGPETNTLTVSKWEISEIKGDMVEDKTLYRFHPYSKESEWDCFNGREENLQNGMGTMYAKDGKIIYRIEELSDADYGNKIFVNKINLESEALYKVKFTIKANKPGTTWFILSPIGGFDNRIIDARFEFGTTEQTFECQSTRELVMDTDFELVWSFGKGYNTESDYTIEISNVEIIKLA